MFDEEREIKGEIWSYEESENMLLIIRDNNYRNLIDVQELNSKVYNEIAEKLSIEGYLRTNEQIRLEIKDLFDDFIAARKNYNKCLFYNILKEIFAETPVSVSGQDKIGKICVIDEASERRRKVLTWSDAETEKMLFIVKENFSSEISNQTSWKLKIFDTISQKLAIEGYTRTGYQISTKLKNLRKDYIQVKKNYKKFCNYYKILDEIYGSRPDFVAYQLERDKCNNKISGMNDYSGYKKFRKIIWSADETEKMLNIIKNDNLINLFDNRKYPNSRIYEEIANQLSVHGYTRTSEQICCKLSSLRKRFVQIKRNNIRTGVERKDCDFYDILNQFYGTRALTYKNGVPYACNVLDDSSSSDTHDNNVIPIRRSKRNIQEIEHILKKKQKFWSREFEEQRQREREANMNSCKKLVSIFKDFLSSVNRANSISIISESLPEILTQSPPTLFEVPDPEIQDVFLDEFAPSFGADINYISEMSYKENDDSNESATEFFKNFEPDIPLNGA